jgi:hypothetical protein
MALLLQFLVRWVGIPTSERTGYESAALDVNWQKCERHGVPKILTTKNAEGAYQNI